MPYTDDPENVPADAVRFYLGDTVVASPVLSDNEVAFLLSDQGDNALRAAARGAEILAGRYSSQADEKQVGPLRLKFTRRSDRYAALARALWSRAAKGGGAPYAGGISITDKNARIQNSDRVRPAFSRRMMRYPLSDRQNDPEELLSPPEVLP